MKLIFALGNPGKEYNWTRHNFGSILLDYYAKTLGVETCAKDKLGAKIISTSVGSEKVILAKSLDFYNNVGVPTCALLNYYKLDPEDLLVLCDDITLPFGSVRFRSGGASGGNNGLKSIIGYLKTDAFPRLRLGTDSPDRLKLGDTAFVLAKFTPEEKENLPPILASATAKINEFLSK